MTLQYIRVVCDVLPTCSSGRPFPDNVLLLEPLKVPLTSEFNHLWENEVFVKTRLKQYVYCKTTTRYIRLMSNVCIIVYLRVTR